MDAQVKSDSDLLGSWSSSMGSCGEGKPFLSLGSWLRDAHALTWRYSGVSDALADRAWETTLGNSPGTDGDFNGDMLEHQMSIYAVFEDI